MKTFNQHFSEAFQQFEGWQEQITNNDILKTAVTLLHKLTEIDPQSQNLIVGGAVRDLLLGQEPHDIDIATSIEMDIVAQHFKVDEIGKSKDFGILNVHFGGYTFEVAQFREEEGYSDFRRPDSVKMVKTFEKDACRRDFRCNALGIDANGLIHDYVGGIDDLRNKIIQTVGEASRRFSEDSLRMLRVFRFSVKLGFKIAHETEKAIIELKDTINNISPERIKDELFKIAALGGPQLANYIEHLDKVGLLEILLPEIKGMTQLKHSPEGHPEAPDVYGHIIAALKQSTSKDAITNLAILFHDLGKLTTAGVGEGGKITYHGHDAEGVAIFEEIAKRFKFSNDQKLAIQFAIEYHMQGNNFPLMKKSKVAAIRQNPNWPVLANTIYADSASRGTKLFDPKEYEGMMKYVDDVFKTTGEKEAFEKKMAQFVDGRMIMNMIAGIEGKDIGKIKEATRDMIIQKDFNVTKEEIEAYIKNMARNLGYENT